jgi:hypothetical protein
MARVTATEVKAIMDNCLLTDTTVNTFILAANKLVTKIFGYSTTEDSMYKEIERWLSAHLIASTLERTTSIEKLGDASVTFTGKWGEGLKSTPYGQMVLLLDTSGELANAGKAAASITAVISFD